MPTAKDAEHIAGTQSKEVREGAYCEVLDFDNRPRKFFLFGERKLSTGGCWKKDKVRKITERRTESLTAFQFRL